MHSKSQSNANYSPEIDGLRAIAVLSVLFYHVGFKSFSGGFVGVDVFFVISGFLITRLIVTENARGTFRFANFYMRRARRIFPALFFTLAISFAAAFALFPPELMAKFAGSLIYAALSLSNIYLYRESGYFDSDAIFKPLLHTWSLSVEEQFYLVWPLLLVWLSNRKWRWAMPATIAALGALSLTAVERSLGNPAAAFYFPQFRVVEFAVGALLVWLVRMRPKSNFVLEILLILGLVLIAYPIFAYNTHTAFPGLHAVVPCVGAALTIFAGRAKIAGTILNNRVSVWIGLISYSLYLVHWPIIVFFRYYRIEPISVLEQCVLVFAAIVAAALMYAYVETPFRRPEHPISAPAFGLACAICTLAICLPAADAWGTGGWGWRFKDEMQAAAAVPRGAVPSHSAASPPAQSPAPSPDANASSVPQEAKEQSVASTMRAELAAVGSPEYEAARTRYIWGNMTRLQLPFTSTSGTKVLVIGDSQAGDFVNILREKHLDEGFELRTLAIVTECQAIIPVSDEVYKNIDDAFKKRCRAEHELLRTSREVQAADVIVLCALWQPWALPHLPNTIEKLAGKGGKKIYVVGRKAQGMTAQMFVTRSGGTANADRFAAKYKNWTSWDINDQLRRIKGAEYIDLMSIACPSAGSCPVFTPNGEIIFYDTTHLTPAGARYFAERLIGAHSLQFLAAGGK